MVTGRRTMECDFCGAPYGAWVASLGMALCSRCERAGTDQSAREPVLVGDVLAGLAGALIPAGALPSAGASTSPGPLASAGTLTSADAPTLPAQKRRHIRRVP